jgi:hypothetical protein
MTHQQYSTTSILLDADKVIEPTVTKHSENLIVFCPLGDSQISFHMTNEHIAALEKTLRNYLNFVELARASDAITQDAPTDYEPDVTPI